MLARIAFLALALTACKGGETTDDTNPGTADDTGGDTSAEPACAFDVSSWQESPLDVVEQADTDGVLSYDPPGVAIVERTGSYDASTGAFAWVGTYDDEHKLVTATVEGELQAEPNRDFTASYTTDTVDVLGETWLYQRDFTVTGCELEAVITNLGEPSESWPSSYTWESEIVSDDEVHQHLETTWYDTPWVENRVLTSDLVTVYDIETGNGAWFLSGTYLADGTHERTTAYIGSTYRVDSEYLYQMDGSYHVYKETRDLDPEQLTATFDADVQYDGSAVGTYVTYDDGETVTCTYTRGADADTDCEVVYDCDNGEVTSESC